MQFKRMMQVLTSGILLFSCAKQEVKNEPTKAEIQEISVDIENDLLVKQGETAVFLVNGGDQKNYSAEVSNAEIVRVVLQEKKVSVTGQKEGETEIIITSAGKKKAVKVKVVSPEKPEKEQEKAEIKIERITFDKNQEILIAGRYHQLQPIIYPENATNRKLTWKSSDEGIIKVDANGNLRVTNKYIGRSASITATATDGSNVFGEITVTITQLVESFEIEVGENANWAVGTIFQLKAIVQPANASAALDWTSSDNQIVSVDEIGKITCLKEGEATIKATTKDGSYLERSIQIKVISEADEIRFERNEICIGRNENNQPLNLSLYYNGELKMKLANSDKTKFLHWTYDNKKLKINEKALTFNTLYTQGEEIVKVIYSDGREEPLQAEIKIIITE